MKGDFLTSGSLLTKNNYTACSGKMKAILLVNKVWDVAGTRRRPNPAPDLVIVFGEAYANQAAIDAANEEVDAFEDAYLKAAFVIADSIPDTEILSVTAVLLDPVVTLGTCNLG